MSDFILDAINEAELTLDCVEAGEDVYACTLTSPKTGWTCAVLR